MARSHLDDSADQTAGTEQGGDLSRGTPAPAKPPGQAARWPAKDLRPVAADESATA